jgi:hypothetical protein
VIDPRGEYDRRAAAWRAGIAEFERTHFILSNVRLAIGVAGAMLLWLAFVNARISPWWPMATWLGFGALAVHHARVLQRGDRARRAAGVYEKGLQRLNHEWAGTGRDGAAFLEGHPYARDLDLFGGASLFELLNTARTEAGETTLAGWLSGGANRSEVLQRQEAVAELRPLVDFREDVAVLAAESPVGRTGALGRWSAARSANLPSYLGVAFAACAIVTATLAGLVYADVISLGWLLAWILVEISFAALWRGPIHHLLHAIETPERDLGLLSELLARIEREPFKSARLAAFHSALCPGGMTPSRRIARLRSLVSWSDSTHNLLFGPIAYVLLVKPQVAVAINSWHRTYGPAVGEWLRIVGELEALSALATYAFEHPADPFPDLVDRGPLFNAQGIGHPLIAEGVAVRNDVHVGGDGPRVVIVSGSNMSGKSTLLRSVGVNVVLALAGGPVRATALRMSEFVLGATLRIDDSLQEGRSRFYAEILRIHTIVDAARGPVPLLFLLDEILHGTNSHDRRIGAEAIVRALVNQGAVGFVTTHDLALTELAATLDGAVNTHFEDRLEKGAMVFDYKMRPGVVEHSNALALMRAIGLDV